MSKALKTALKAFDNSPTALAAAIGGDVKRQHVEHWLNKGRVPPAHRPSIERVTEGRIRCEDMDSGGDATWARIPDADWPWHPAGRPVLDVTRVAA
jgi:DNA-binding transcriptional regulator YdaS (Cro superfamily)